MTAKSRSHEEATIEAFDRDSDYFIRYVRDVLQDLEPRMNRLEAQQATLMEMVKALMARPVSPMTQPPQPTDWKPQYRDPWGNWLPPGAVPDYRFTSGYSTNPWSGNFYYTEQKTKEE